MKPSDLLGRLIDDDPSSCSFHGLVMVRPLWASLSAACNHLPPTVLPRLHNTFGTVAVPFRGDVRDAIYEMYEPDETVASLYLPDRKGTS